MAAGNGIGVMHQQPALGRGLSIEVDITCSTLT